jgi:uncharacterized protein with ParB-like and HNH nuclease domain
MKASSLKIQDFLSSNNTQFVIPIYQRNYDWTISQCSQLLNDINDIGNDNKNNAHFIGSIVFIHDGVYTSGGMNELIIIDGQQRLTTLTLIYLVIYWLGKELKDDKLSSEMLEVYLINKFSTEINKLKLRPSENNEKALKHLFTNSNNDYSEFSKLIDNFNYFRSKISENNYQVILKGLSKLMFVEISLDRQYDNPQRIFESLNSTGLALSQADLIRNYILMGLKREDQNRIYRTYWETIENLAKDETLNTSRVSEFIRDFLTLKNKKIPNKNKVYDAFKINYPENTLDIIDDDLSEIKILANHYNKLINPEKEIDKDIQKQLKYINKLEINVAFPFLMKVYDDYHKEIINKDVFIRLLEFIQSYTWRRFIVGVPTNALNKIFMTLYEKVDINNYLESIQRSLLIRNGSQRFPKDNEVLESLRTKDVYNIQSKNRTYLLERLENYNNKESVIIDNNQDITIEHIFPQTPDKEWKVELNIEEFNFIKENYLNTIGNITLSGYNSKLSNKSFLYKRDLKDAGFKDSRLWLNKYLSKCENWNKNEIEKRFEVIFKRFIKIWKYPKINIAINLNEKEVNIFNADDPKHKKLDYFILFDQKYVTNQITQLYLEVFKQLFEKQPETFFTSKLNESIRLTKHPTQDGIRQATPINDTYFIETNIQNTVKFDKIKQALILFGFEDELIIKYSE